MKIKGLLLKEVYAQRSTVIIYAVMVAAFAVSTFISDALGPIMLFPCFISSSTGLNSFTLDERGWEKYAYALPCRANEIILSKYIFDFVCKFTVLLLMISARLIGSFVFDFEFMSGEFAFNLVLVFAVYTVMYCLIPLYFKLANKALVASCAAIGGVSGIAVNFLFFKEDKVLNVGLTPVVISLCILIISIPVTYYISVRQYKKQDI